MDINITRTRYWSRQHSTALHCSPCHITLYQDVVPRPVQPRYIVAGVEGRGRLLADKKHVDSAEIEIVVEWECSKTVVCGMLTSIKLSKGY